MNLWKEAKRAMRPRSRASARRAPVPGEKSRSSVQAFNASGVEEGCGDERKCADVCES